VRRAYIVFTVRAGFPAVKRGDNMKMSLTDAGNLIGRAIAAGTLTAEEGGAAAMLCDERCVGEWRASAIAVLVDEVIICKRCGGIKPAGQSCGCFDNGGE
jgi:hypothetical protein